MSPDFEKLLVTLGALIATATALYKLIIQPIGLAWKTREESIKRLEADVVRIQKERDEAWARAREEMTQLQTEREEVSKKLQDTLERVDDTVIERSKLQEEIAQLRERNKRIEEDSNKLKEEVRNQAGTIEQTLIAHDNELSRMNDATASQLSNMRKLLNASQSQIASLQGLYEAVRLDLDASKREFEKKVDELATEIDNYRRFLQEIGLEDVVIDKIGEGKLLVEEAKTTIVTSLTKRDTSEIEAVVPTEE